MADILLLILRCELPGEIRILDPDTFSKVGPTKCLFRVNIRINQLDFIAARVSPLSHG